MNERKHPLRPFKKMDEENEGEEFSAPAVQTYIDEFKVHHPYKEGETHKISYTANIYFDTKTNTTTIMIGGKVPVAEIYVGADIYSPLNSLSEPYNWVFELVTTIDKFMEEKGWGDLRRKEWDLPEGILEEQSISYTTVYRPDPENSPVTIPTYNELSDIIDKWFEETATKTYELLDSIKWRDPFASWDEPPFIDLIVSVEITQESSALTRLIDTPPNAFPWNDTLKQWDKVRWLRGVVTLLNLLGKIDDKMVEDFAITAVNQPNTVTLNVVVDNQVVASFESDDETNEKDHETEKGVGR